MIPDFALARPTFTHTTQTEQVAMAPPPTQPIDFDSNPDVLALKSAISILQLQRARATADIQSLSRARDAALARPAAFAADLEAGRVQVEGDALFGGARAARGATAAAADDSPSSSDSDSESDSNEDDDDDDDPAKQEETPESETKADGGDGDTPMTDTPAMADGPSNPPQPPNPPLATATTTATATKPKRKKGKQKPTTSSPAAPPWQTLPKPQSIVRCPPINWAQYGIVGESLDKLHAEQVAAPTPGAPMALGPGGTYEFKAGAADQGGSAAGGGEQPRRLVGVAAPYNPMRDKVEKKGKGGKR
jgi:hypothetical protein